MPSLKQSIRILSTSEAPAPEGLLPVNDERKVRSLRWKSELARQDRLRSLLERLETKYREHRRELLQGGLPSRHLLFDKDTYARLLAETIRDETYEPSPGTVRQVRIGKMRSLFTCELVDFLVHGAVAEVLADAAIKTLLSATSAGTPSRLIRARWL